MREIASGNPNSRITVLDETGRGGACHHYYIGRKSKAYGEPDSEFCHVNFQDGPVREVGVNGCHQEDLLEIIIDRLQGFQAGDFACRENALALTKCQEALFWLQHRTAQRVKRGVEGTNTK